MLVGPPLDSRAMLCGNELTVWELDRSDGEWRMRREASPIELRPPAVFLLPTRYSRPETTPLRAKVVAGRGQTFHFELLDD